METALYHPSGGYFTGERLRSVQSGDFLTSPEVSPLFGETLAALVVREADRAGLLRPTVVDAGAGSGSLLRPLLSVLGDDAEPWAVEVSPPAREALAKLLGGRRVVGDLSELPSAIRGVIFANELLDNLPMALARRSGRRWRELWVERWKANWDGWKRRSVQRWKSGWRDTPGRRRKGGWWSVNSRPASG